MTTPFSFDRLVAVEPSLQIDGAWRACFELDGRHVRCALDVGGWVRLSVSLPGSEKDLIGQQGRLLLPLKIVSGPALIAELPPAVDLASTFTMLRAALRQGLASLISADAEVLREERPTDAAPRFEALLEESAYAWDRKDDHLSTRAGTARVVASLHGPAAVFRANLVRLGPVPGASVDALTHFVVAANARFRFVRMTLLSDRLVEEVVLPVAVLTPSLVNGALGAVRDSVRVTRRACAALADARVADQYLEFHEQRKDAYADTQHRSY